MSTISDETLTVYYDLRSKAEARWVASLNGASPHATDPLRDEIEATSERLYRERLGSVRGLRIAEVGPGGGDFVKYALANGAASVALIDISSDRLETIQREIALTPGANTVSSIVADAKRFSGVPDASFDLLVAKEVIEHLTDYRPFLAEIQRVLRAGGKLYLTTPNRHCVDLWPRLLFGAIAKKPQRTGNALVREVFGHLYEFLDGNEIATLEGTLPPGFREHIHEFSPGELIRALRAHQLRVIRKWATPPQMFYHELRFAARAFEPKWNRSEDVSYGLGDNLRIIAERT